MPSRPVLSWPIRPQRVDNDCCGGTFDARLRSDVSLAFAGGAVAVERRKLYDFRRCDLRGCGKLPEHVGRTDLGPAGRRAPALATLRVNEAPLVVSMGFSRSTIAQGGVSRLSYGLRNDAAVGATSISLSDTLPAGLVVASAPNAATTCAGGVLTAPAGGDTNRLLPTVSLARALPVRSSSM